MSRPASPIPPKLNALAVIQKWLCSTRTRLAPDLSNQRSLWYSAWPAFETQHDTDRYLRLSMVKVPSTYKSMPAFLLRRMPWYFARIWVQVTPIRILWWPTGEIEGQPQLWRAPTETVAPASDPAPSGKAPGKWKDGPADWREMLSMRCKTWAIPS